MPLNPNMVAIQTVTVGAGGAASIDFTSIPQTYTDLNIVVSARTNRALTVDGIVININGSASNFSGRYLEADGVSAYSGTSTTIAGSASSANATASTFGNTSIYIPNYTSSNNKSFSVDTVAENNGTVGLLDFIAGLWSNTAAITSITLAPFGGTTFSQYSTATLYGITSAAVGAKATGGIISQDANYYYHTFTSSGTFTPTQSLTADYLVVAGGGGGGTFAGGAGAGGLRCTVGATGGGGSLESPLSLTATNYTVTIGAGGSGGSGSPGAGSNGSNSVFSTITSTGGGKTEFNTNGTTGGSGGGTTLGNSGGAGTANQGYAGGNGSATYNGGSGGGGAGAVGANTTSHNGATGGAGVTTSIQGLSATFAGGGGGGADGLSSVGGNTSGTGGSGGGGTGSNGSTAATSGSANTGGGGGGGGRDSSGNRLNGGAGGSGIVIVRYAK